MKKLAYLSILLIAVSLASCDRSKSINIEYIPFQSENDGRYGLISPAGDVLVSEEFKVCPTIATEGRFWAMNKDGYYELYKTSKEPEKVGSEYRYVSPFYNGHAIVAERDKNISIVDKNGETVVSLKKIDKYSPDFITNMSEGHAVFAVDTLQGVINYDGEMIVKPNYYMIAPMHDGMMVARDRTYSMGPDMTGKMPKGYLTVLNDHGEKVLKISSKKYADATTFVYGDYLPVAVVRDSTLNWGIINMKGEEIVKPSSSYAQITEMQGENFIYKSKDEKYGVRNIKGEKLLEAKYEYLQFAGKNILLSSDKPISNAKSDEDNDYQCSFIDINGEKLTKKYASATLFMPRAQKYAFVKTESGKIYIIDSKGEKKDDTPRIVNIIENFGDNVILSDYINIDLFLGNVGFSQAGVDSLTFSSGVQTVLNRQARHFSMSSKQKPSDLLNTSQVYISRTVDGQNVSEIVYFPTTLSHRTYRNETVYDYDYYYNYYGNYWDTYWYSYNRQVPAGYEFSNTTPSKFEMTFDNYGVLRGKLKQFYNKLANEFKQMGTVIDENNSAVLVRLSGGREAVVFLDGHNVTARWGSLSASDKNISSHAGAKETIAIDY